MKLRLITMDDGLVEPVCAAYGRAFCATRPPAAWRRIHGDSPDGATGVVCLDEENAVVGYFGATRHRLTGASADNVYCGQIRDVFTHPAARGAGTGRGSLFARLGLAFQNAHCGQDMQIVWGFASERHFRLGARLLGYRRIGGVAMWQREVAPPRLVATGRLGALAPIAVFDDEVNALWARRSTTVRMAIPRTAAFLNWRFVSYPQRGYVCLRYDSFLADSMAGYIVVAPHGEEARLADFLLPDDADLRRDMWLQLLDRLARAGYRRLTLIASTAVAETACLPALGCTNVTAELPWVAACISYASGYRESELGMSFHLTMADGDAC